MATVRDHVPLLRCFEISAPISFFRRKISRLHGLKCIFRTFHKHKKKPKIVQENNVHQIFKEKLYYGKKSATSQTEILGFTLWTSKYMIPDEGPGSFQQAYRHKKRTKMENKTEIIIKSNFLATLTENKFMENYLALLD